jgi:hypothetical protein
VNGGRSTKTKQTPNLDLLAVHSELVIWDSRTKLSSKSTFCGFTQSFVAIGLGVEKASTLKTSSMNTFGTRMACSEWHSAQKHRPRRGLHSEAVFVPHAPATSSSTTTLSTGTSTTMAPGPPSPPSSRGLVVGVVAGAAGLLARPRRTLAPRDSFPHSGLFYIISLKHMISLFVVCLYLICLFSV